MPSVDVSIKAVRSEVLALQKQAKSRDSAPEQTATTTPEPPTSSPQEADLPAAIPAAAPVEELQPVGAAPEAEAPVVVAPVVAAPEIEAPAVPMEVDAQQAPPKKSAKKRKAAKAKGPAPAKQAHVEQVIFLTPFSSNYVVITLQHCPTAVKKYLKGFIS